MSDANQTPGSDAQAPVAALSGQTSPGATVGEAVPQGTALAQHIAQRSTTPRPDCLIWMGATDRGYGRIYVDGTAKRVHRVAWELKNGPIPEGLTIDHLCMVRACCNTEHMELVTLEENQGRAKPHRPRTCRFDAPSDAPRAPRQVKLATHCKNGHEYTAENTRICGNGARGCRTCIRASKKRARERERQANAA